MSEERQPRPRRSKGSGSLVDRQTRRLEQGVREARRRFGGFDLPASLAGTLCAVGLTVVLAGILAAAGSYGYQRGIGADDLSLGGLIAGLSVLLLGFLTGGWVAGRIARYDGLRNGLFSAVWFVLLVAAVAALGAWAGDRYDFFEEVNLPQWFRVRPDSAASILTALAGILVVCLAGAIGGARGERYHRRADEVMARAMEKPVRGNEAGSVGSDSSGERDRSGPGQQAPAT